MKSRITLVLVALLTLVALGAAAAEDKPTTFLFVQNATSGELTALPGTTGHYELLLRGVSPTTVYFSDRPERIVGQLPMSAFLDALGFPEDDPPNAALDVAVGSEADIIVVELRKPRYDAATAELRYQVEVLKTADGGLAEFSGRTVKALPSKFETASLFIDDCADDQLYCYRRSDDKYVGKITVGFCWSIGQLACHPCHKFSSYNDQCNRDYSTVCKGDCFADDTKH